MQKLAYISPLYWGLQSYLDVLLRESAFTMIMPKLDLDRTESKLSMGRENVRQRVRGILVMLGKLSQSKKALTEFRVGFSGINATKNAVSYAPKP